jgi:hypothetical protein
MAKDKKDQIPDKFDWKDSKEFLEDEVGLEEFKHNLFHDEDGNLIERYEIDENHAAEVEEKRVFESNLKEDDNYYDEKFEIKPVYDLIIGHGIAKEAFEIEQELEKDGFSLKDLRKLDIKDEDPEDNDPVLIEESLKKGDNYDGDMEVGTPVNFYDTVINMLFRALENLCENEKDKFRLELLKDGLTYTEFVRNIQIEGKKDDEDDLSYLIDSLAATAGETKNLPILIETKNKQYSDPIKDTLFYVTGFLQALGPAFEKIKADGEGMQKDGFYKIDVTFDLQEYKPAKPKYEFKNESHYDFNKGPDFDFDYEEKGKITDIFVFDGEIKSWDYWKNKNKKPDDDDDDDEETGYYVVGPDE